MGKETYAQQELLLQQKKKKLHELLKQQKKMNASIEQIRATQAEIDKMN